MSLPHKYHNYLLQKAVEEYRKIANKENVSLFEGKVFFNNNLNRGIMNPNEDNDLELQREADIISNKELRVSLDKNLQVLKGLKGSRERALAITKLQETIMWLGMDLKRLNVENPYPDSYNPSNTKINPTSDGLKM